MKKATFFLLFLSHYAISQEVVGVWNGTMTMEEKYVGVTGASHKVVKIQINNNIVTGTVESTDSLVLNGKVTSTSHCTGSGNGELYKLVFNADGTYDIEATSPHFTCPGADKEGTYGLQAHSQPTGSNRNVLSGTQTNSAKIGNFGDVYTINTWSLSQVTGEKLIVFIDGYIIWLPEPGKDEFTTGNTLMIRMELQDANGVSYKMKAKRFELRLHNTSHEPGITINKPAVPTLDFPDLGFLDQRSVKPMQIAGAPMVQEFDIPCNCSVEFATLGSFDGGGYTTLTVDAILPDDTRIQGKLNYKGLTEIPIPYRDPGSHIANAWMDPFGTGKRFKDTYDNESSPGNTNNGDGLTAYEEYRGVISSGSFKRLSPEKKELGVWVKKTELATFLPGMKALENAAGIKVVPFVDNEIKPDRKFNVNYMTAHIFDQYVQRLERGSLNSDVVSENRPVITLTKTPQFSEQVVIDIPKITAGYRPPLASRLNEFIAKAVAHELSHGIYAADHGPTTLVSGFIIDTEHLKQLKFK